MNANKETLQSPGQLAGKTAIVTGGGRGIGRAVCEKLSSLGANIVINYTSNDTEAAVTQSACPGSIIVRADISSEDEAKRIFEACDSAFGSPHILVNNAGMTRDGLLMRMSGDDFQRVMDVNLKGAFIMTKLASKPMMKARYGRIVNISSVVALIGNVGQVNYVASKAGIIGLTKASALELAPRGITVNAVAPGFIETDMTNGLTDSVKFDMLSRVPLGRFGTPNDVAELVAWLCGDAASYITGQVVSVNGGMI